MKTNRKLLELENLETFRQSTQALAGARERDYKTAETLSKAQPR